MWDKHRKEEREREGGREEGRRELLLRSKSRAWGLQGSLDLGTPAPQWAGAILNLNPSSIRVGESSLHICPVLS
jgi:hypothetical protein